MNMEKFAKKFAHKLGEEVNFENIKHYLEKNGWTIYFYNDEFDDVITAMALSGVAKKSKGFVHRTTSRKMVFIKNNLDYLERLEVILHELGHILLEHHISTKDLKVKEIEANAFVHAMFRIVENREPLHSRISAFIPLVVAISLTLGVGIGSHFFNQSKYIEINTPTSTEKLNNISSENIKSDLVYITPTGKCYHRASCRTINLNTATLISFTQASKNYRACKVCINN